MPKLNMTVSFETIFDEDEFRGALDDLKCHLECLEGNTLHQQTAEKRLREAESLLEAAAAIVEFANRKE